MTRSVPHGKGCCSPTAAQRHTAPTGNPLGATSATSRAADTVRIPGGPGGVGTNSPLLVDDGEGPYRRTRVRAFRMGRNTVTNEDFARFVSEAGYVTDAERYGWSFVFWSDVYDDEISTRSVTGQDWWRQVHGANWRDIHGPGSQTDHWHPDHPVVHVSWHDATAFARWARGRLPTEAEWEHAARGGLGDVRYPWGEREPDDVEFLPCNIWQGSFPDRNTARDGWPRTAPVQSFTPNAFGLFNMVGNVWEWTAEPFRIRSLKRNAHERMQKMRGYKLLKGGSFLCHSSYCHRYRIAARIGNSPDTTTTHQSFRVVWND